MDRLPFPMAPTVPEQCCCFFSREPPVTGLTLGRKRHAHHAPVKAFLCVMVDRCAKCLEVAACTTTTAAMFAVGRTGQCIDLQQFLAAPKFVEPFNPSLDLELVARLADIGQIDRQNVGAIDVLDVLPAAFGLILSSDVVR